MATQQAEGRKRVEDFRKAYHAMKSGEGTSAGRCRRAKCPAGPGRRGGTSAASTTGRQPLPPSTRQPHE